MALTVADVEIRVREILADEQADAYRWSVPKITRFIYDGIKLLHSIRPDSRYVNLELSSFELPVIDDAAGESVVLEYQAYVLPLEDRWLMAVVNYVVHRCFEMDAADTVNAARSDRHKAEFERLAML
jgi:hypothetical protein